MFTFGPKILVSSTQSRKPFEEANVNEALCGEKCILHSQSVPVYSQYGMVPTIKDVSANPVAKKTAPTKTGYAK